MRKLVQSTGVVLSPNPTTDSGIVRFDTTWGDARFVNESQAAGGDLTGTYPNPTLATSGVSSGTYGSATQVGQFAVDAKGRLTSAGNVAISGVPPGGNAGGDLTGTYPNPAFVNSGVSSGTYGNATQVGQFTVDSKGRLTSASNVTITGVPPGGSAGGALAGTYPNPTIAADSVTSAKILDGTIAAGDLAATGVSAGTYGSSTQVSQVTVNSKGQVTGASNVNISGVPPGGNAGGDLTGTYPNPTLNASGVSAGTYGSATQVSQVTVNAKGQVTSATNVAISGVPPGGSAGGGLTGTYPNPTIAADAVSSGSIVDGSVTSVDIRDTTLNTADLKDASVTMAKLNQAGAGTGQVIKWNGTAWAPGNDSAGSGGGGGTVRKVVPTTGVVISPNPLTDSGTVGFDTTWGDGRFVNESQANSVSGAMITDGQVSSADMRDTTISTAKLKDAAVTAAKLNEMGAASGQVMKWNGTAWAAANDSVGTGGSGTVRKVYQSTGVVVSPNPITDSGTVRFDTTWGDARFVNEAQTAGGGLTGTYPSPTIAADVVSSGNIVDGSVTSADIRDTTITTAKLKDDAVTSAKVLDGTITSADIRDTTVITTDVKDAAITAPKLSQMGASSGQVMKWNGSAWSPANDSVGGGVGTVRKVYQSTGVVLSPNPITDSGTVRFDSTWGDARFVNEAQAAGGDLAGSYPSPTLTTSGVSSGTYGSATQVGQFTVDTKGRLTSAGNVTISGVPPGGSAGGGLTGTYPNPTIAADAVSSSNIVDGSVASADIRDTTVNTTDLKDAAVTAPKLNQMGASSGQVLKWNGTAWTPRNDSMGAGTVRKVTQATGVVISPNPLSDSGTVGFDTAWGDARFVNEAQAAGGDLTGIYPSPTLAVSGVSLGSYGSATQVGQFTVDTKGRLTSAGNVSITGVPPGGAAGGGLSGTYPNPTIAANAVSSSNVVDGSITSADIRDTTVNTADLKDGAVTMAKLNQDGAAAGQVIKWTGTTWAPRNDSTGISGSGTAGYAARWTGTGSLGTSSLRDTGGGNVAVGGPVDANSRIYVYDGPSFGVYATSTIGCGVYGMSTNSKGVYGTSSYDNGVNGTSSTGYGVYGSSSSNHGICGSSTDSAGVRGTSTNGVGVSGVSSYGCGVKGISTTGYGAYDSSAGTYGLYAAGGSYGVYGKGGHGVYGISTSSLMSGVEGVGQDGMAVEGYRVGGHGGTGYAEYSSRDALHGYSAEGDTYAFGAAGFTHGDDIRTGGVLGAVSTAGTWGSLGYKNSSSTWYAGYGTSGWTSGSGLSNHEATGIGCGYGGGLMGGWLKGKCYGATVSGDRYALYSQGNAYTSGYTAEMQTTGGRREAAYGTTSTSVDIYTSGVAEMKSGTASVSFPASFSTMVSKDVPVVVTATPMGPASIYLSSSNSKGFTVAAVDAKASVKFSWIAVGRRAGYETNPEVPVELTKTDFDSKMDGVMYNENDLRHSAQPVWFDGTQLRFDNPPADPVRPKPAQPVNVGLQAPSHAPTPDVPVNDVMPSRATAAPVNQPSSTQSSGAEK